MTRPEGGRAFRIEQDCDAALDRSYGCKDEFCYDPEQDGYICPAGQVLSTRCESKLRELTKTGYANRAACPVCPLGSRCTHYLRNVLRLENEAGSTAWAARLKAKPEILERS